MDIAKFRTENAFHVVCEQMRNILFCCIVLCSFQAVGLGQTIQGKVTDERQQPVEGATIVLQALDSTYLDATISGADGTFLLNRQPKEYRLVVQHLLYETRQITGKGEYAGIIELQSKDYALDEVVVKAERPFVKVEAGRLGYDLSVFARHQAVNNAWEALTKLPGVRKAREL